MKNLEISKFKLLNFLVSFLLILSAAILIFYPISKEQFIYEWQPNINGNEARLTLVEFEPDEFSIQFPCDLVAETDNWIFETKGGKAFQISLSKKVFTVLLGNLKNEIDSYTININEEINCNNLVLKIIKDNRTIQIYNNNNLVIEKKLKPDSRFEIASYVIWNPDVDSKEVLTTIKTSSNLFSKDTKIREIFKFILIILLISIILISTIKNFKYSINISSSKLDRNDLGSAAYLIFLALFLHTILDDGLYLIELAALKTSNVFTQYLYPVAFPVGEWHFFITSLFYSEKPSIFLMRIIPAVVLLIIWKIFKTIWLDKILDENIRKRATLLTWTIWAFFSAAFLLSIRPEVYVALALIMNLTLIKIYFEKGYSTSFLITIPVSAFALSLHQTGIIVLFLVIIPWLHLLLNKNIKLIDFYYFVLSISISVYLVFHNNNIFTLVGKIRDFESVNNWPLPFHETLSWNDPPWMEWKRVKHIFLADPLPFAAGLTAVLIVVTLALTLLARWNSYKIEDKLFISSMLTASIGISLAPSKWVNHYAALLPILLVGIIYLYKQFNSKFLIMSLFLVATFQLLGFNKNWVAGSLNIYSLDLTNPVVKFFYNVVNDTYLLRNLTIILLLILILFLFLKYKYKNHKGLQLLTIILIFISIFRQMSPTTIDVVIGKPGWSVGDQVISGFLNEDERCGIFSPEELNLAGIDLTKDLFAFVTPQGYAIYPCLRPTPIEAGIWKFPNYSVGNIHRWDQQRLMNRMAAENVYCFDSGERLFSGTDEVCIYKWTSEIPDMKLKS